MRIPQDAEIGPEKISGYLLMPRPSDDKSKFLGQAGFTLDRPDELLGSLRRLASEVEASEDGVNEFGTFFRADGPLDGPDGPALAVATV